MNILKTWAICCLYPLVPMLIYKLHYPLWVWFIPIIGLVVGITFEAVATVIAALLG